MRMRVLAGTLLGVSVFAADAPMLGNYDVFLMVKKGVPTEQIVSAIRGSRPRFNLDPIEVGKLTGSGVSQEIIDAMTAKQLALKDQRARPREEHAIPATAKTPAPVTAARLNSAQVPASGSIMIPSGTRISCRLEQTISSATADEGQQVQLVVTEDVKAGDVLLVAQGSPVVGTIVQSLAKRRMGRTGKLDFSIDKVRATDGKFIPVRYSLNKKEGGSHAVSTGVMTAGAAVLFFPAAPFFLLRKGKDVNINKGMVFEVFTDEDHSLAASPVASVPASGQIVNAVAELAAITITSDATGADIEIDGAFVGNTPSSRKLTPGLHKIVVRNGKKVWERTIEVQAETAVTVHAKVAEMP
jgi:hypothetical protein